MRIVVVGAVQFTASCLEAIVEAGGDVVGVLTLEPERLAAHGDGIDLSETAERLGMPLHRIRNVNDPETISLLQGLRPDVIFVLGWSQLLGEELLALAPSIGSHPALLPRDRGRHPITWALIDGAERSGLTFLWLDAGADSGDILWQREFPIGPYDDAADVYARIETLAREAIAEFLPLLEAGTAPRIPQDDSLATYRHKRTDDDRLLDWRLPSKALHNLVRGLARPYVGAVLRRCGEDVVVWKARVADDDLELGAVGLPLGSVVAAGEGCVAVRTGTGWLRLLETEPADVLAPGDLLEVPS